MSSSQYQRVPPEDKRPGFQKTSMRTYHEIRPGTILLFGSIVLLLLSNYLRNTFMDSATTPEKLERDLRIQHILESLARQQTGRLISFYRNMASIFQNINPVLAQRFLNMPTSVWGDVLIGQAIRIHDQINTSPFLNPGAFQVFGPGSSSVTDIQNQQFFSNRLRAFDNLPPFSWPSR